MKKNTYLAILLFGLSCLLSQSCKNKVEENISPLVTQSFDEVWKFKAGEGVDSLWMNPAYDDSAWSDALSSLTLKEQKLVTENDWGWYRKKIVLSDTLKKSIEQKGAAILHLNKFASCEEVYINGKLIGKTGEFPPNYTGYTDHERNYLVMAEDLDLDGENLIAIKFNEGWGIGGFLGGKTLEISSAGTNDKIQMDVVTPGTTDNIFKSPCPVAIVTTIKNKNKWDVSGKLFVTVTTDDFNPVQVDSLDIEIEGGTTFSKEFRTDNLSPGFYRYTVELIRDTVVATQKKFNIGFDPEKIESPLDAQADFNEFWDNSLTELSKIAPRYKMTLQPDVSSDDYEIYLVEMYSLENELIKGYYAKPRREGKHPVLVEYMGYGSSPYLPTRSWDGFAHFVLSTRGQGLNQQDNHYGKWITYGLEDKDTYYYRGAFMDVVRAIDFVCSRPEVDAEKIGVKGGSQGGAFTFAAAALDKRVKAAAPTIPFLSDYRGYFNIAKWPKSDFDVYMEEHPEAQWQDIYTTLSYFDIKNLAQRIQCPLFMGIGVQDEVCPPHINFAAYNQVKADKKWMAFANFGHSVGKEYYEESARFFKKNLNVKD